MLNFSIIIKWILNNRYLIMVLLIVFFQIVTHILRWHSFVSIPDDEGALESTWLVGACMALLFFHVWRRRRRLVTYQNKMEEKDFFSWWRKKEDEPVSLQTVDVQEALMLVKTGQATCMLSKNWFSFVDVIKLVCGISFD